MTEDCATRDAWVEIDLDAIAHNLGVIRRLAGRARVYAVCKGHAYGFDAGVIARVAQRAGIDALAVGDPDDARAIRNAGVELPILVYGSTGAHALASIAVPGVVVTAHDAASLQACLARALTFSLKLDCGFGRMGFRESDLPALLHAIATQARAPVHGVYTHIADAGNAESLAQQVAAFERMTAAIAAAGWSRLERMVASSRVLIARPELALDAVNPGRLVYGILEAPWEARVDVRPALRAVKARVIAVKQVPRGTVLGYASEPVSVDTTLAVIPYGFADGYPRSPAGASALLRGVRVPIVGLRHTEHSVLDVTAVPDAALGDEVVLMGGQGSVSIGPADIERVTGVPLLELVARLARGPNRRYVGDAGAH